MIDVHSHIIFGVDDGPSTMEESLRMVYEAERAGIKVVIATPHYQKDIFENEKVMENYQRLLNRIIDYDVTLLLGYEVFLNPFIPGIMQNKHDLSLNGSDYLLFELPFDSIPMYSYDTIYKLQLKNIIPILAHPERNRNFVSNFNELLNFIERGCLVQLDAASIIGVYGGKAKEFAKKLIKLNMAHFVASDAHCAKDYMHWYCKAYGKVVRWAGEEYADKLFSGNAKVILENRKESVYKLI